MESGINKNILLSIAIPTWNRDEILFQSLSNLLPQVENYLELVEVIVSDNASTDNTLKVVENFKKQFPQINIIQNVNSTNVHFYGNFIKCRELSNGKYIWLLSDDDHIMPELLNQIISILSGNEKLAVLFLKNSNNRYGFSFKQFDRDKLLVKENYKIGLISSTIFLNDKRNDKFIIESFTGNGFIGLILLLNSFNFYNKVIVLNGQCLKTSRGIPKGYNYFELFIKHFQKVKFYLHYINIPPTIIKRFRSKYLIELILSSYILYKTEGKLKFGDFKNDEINEIEKWIQEDFSDLTVFWLVFYPFILVPKSILQFLYYIRKIFKTFIKASRGYFD